MILLKSNERWDIFLAFLLKTISCAGLFKPEPKFIFY